MATIAELRKKPRKNKTHPITSRPKPGASTKFGIKDTPETRIAFLAVLATAQGTPTRAAAAVGIDRRTAYLWREADPEFAKQWEDAVEQSTDALEQEARRRAHDGVDKPVFQQGEKVGVIREYSDTLMVALLRGRRANVFRDRTEHVGEGGGPVQHEVRIKFVRAEKKK